MLFNDKCEQITLSRVVPIILAKLLVSPPSHLRYVTITHITLYHDMYCINEKNISIL